MDFGQKWMLWGLLLGFLPILIHLFNRLRHRKLPWAAMMFLRMANRKSTRYAKLRQWLVLLFRVLAVLALIFALSKPLVGGSFTKWFSGKPEVILIVLDRSASMGAGPDKDNTLLKQAVKRIVSDLKGGNYDGVRVVLLEHTDRAPREMSHRVMELKKERDKLKAKQTKATSGSDEAKKLKQELDVMELKISALGKGAATMFENYVGQEVADSAADLPTLLEAAAKWFEEEQPGKSEIWIATDLQASNWGPAAEKRWRALNKRLAALPQSVSVRLMAMDAATPGNVSVRVESVVRHGEGDRAKLNLQIKLASDQPIDPDVGVAVFINGKGEGKCDIGKVVEDSESHVFDIDFVLPDTEHAPWGYVELVNSEDGNAQDNRAYFVYGEPTANRVAVVGDASRFSTRFFKLAAAPDPDNKLVTSEILAPDRLQAVDWADYEMVIWQGTLPEGVVAEALTKFTEAGGMLVCFADDGPSGGPFHDVQWGRVQQAQVKNETFATWQKLVEAEAANDHLGFVISNYKSNEGPFKATEEGLYIPVNDLRINQCRPVIHPDGEGTVLANLVTGETMVLRRSVGKGQVIFVATRPTDDWSSLTEGLVAVPMLERLLVEGEAARSGKFINETMRDAGDDLRVDKNERWISEDTESGQGKDVDTQAGVYRKVNSKQLVAVNRPAKEDSLTQLEDKQVGGLFGDVPLTMKKVKSGSAPDEKKPLWKLFLALMALVLLVEGLLILPKATDEGVEIQRSTTGKVGSPQAT
ncbi:MAG: BatA domain-containing protein [Verrucomicrobiota bacterium]|nr:BatA domain-containing protein [Verrucomicrobiota bacterium]